LNPPASDSFLNVDLYSVSRGVSRKYQRTEDGGQRTENRRQNTESERLGRCYAIGERPTAQGTRQKKKGRSWETGRLVGWEVEKLRSSEAERPGVNR
jgi:hypothetical protein